MKKRKRRDSLERHGSVWKGRQASWKWNEPLGTYGLESVSHQTTREKKRRGLDVNKIGTKEIQGKPQRNPTFEWNEQQLKNMLGSRYDRLIKNIPPLEIQIKIQELRMQTKETRLKIKKLQERAIKEHWTTPEFLESKQEYEDQLKKIRWRIESLQENWNEKEVHHRKHKTMKPIRESKMARYTVPLKKWSSG